MSWLVGRSARLVASWSAALSLEFASRAVLASCLHAIMVKEEMRGEEMKEEMKEEEMKEAQAWQKAEEEAWEQVRVEPMVEAV